ncbi:hypothetical protein ST47_g2644 [Ascochyta rabiei]|uniref:Uncharacterized protein n=1 Tax=Didymella rabiei TaxID=5454 RepID=A0A163J8W3_DIDRA|nr:hypothetical protein ST47_g2644 [Ascochyta rabiei]
MYLGKRDNMGFQMAPALIIFLVILGAGALVVCGFAVMRFWGGDEEKDTGYMNRSVEQDRYMREVRERTWGKLPNYYSRRQQYDPSSRVNMPFEGQSVRVPVVTNALDRYTQAERLANGVWALIKERDQSAHGWLESLGSIMLDA